MSVDHTKNIIEVSGVSFAYNEDLVLENVDLNIHKGDYLGVIGPNGGGTFDKQVLINWTISTDPNNDFVRYDLDYSNNSGVNWYNLIQNYGYENKLNDSSPNVTLNYIGNENKTVYLRIPKNSNVLSAKIDLTGFQS